MCIRDRHVSDEFAAVRLQTKIENASEKTEIRIETEILSPDGKVVTRKENKGRINHCLLYTSRCV